MPGRFAFLPHARTRLAADARPDGGQRLAVAYDVVLLADGAAQPPAIPVSAPLRGPGDVIAIAPAAIARVEPEPGLRGFEPSYFPFIEFIDADFPWRYSLDAGPGRRKAPWLALVALKPDEFEFVQQGVAPLPRIRVASASASLPDLSQRWATGHVQVNLPDDGSRTADEALEDDPANGFARLFCCRKLEERTSYFLFLVPAYKAGVLAGLGARETASPFDAPAWASSAPEPVELPVYHQTRFSTDALQDVEYLLRRLRPLSEAEANGAAAPRRASAAEPGYYPGYANATAAFEVQTALSRPGTRPDAVDTDPVLAGMMARTLTEVIAGDAADDDVEDPLVAFPPYGFRFRQETEGREQEVREQRARANVWFDRINLDLKMRHVASLGAETVRRNQDYFADLCWDQYESLREANLRLGRLQAAERLAERLVEKHFNRLSPDVAFTLSEPLHSNVALGPGATLQQRLADQGAPAAFASRAVRRVAAKRPVPQPRAGAFPGWAIPVPSIPGDRTPGPVSAARPRGRPFSREGTLLTGAGLGDLLGGQLFAVLGDGAFAGQKRPRAPAVRVAPFESRAFSAAVSDTLRRLPKLKATFTVSGRVPAEEVAINPIYRTPAVPLPLSDYVRTFAPGAFLSGVASLPMNSVSVFEENRYFIEAFLVGANHAINDELRWREFPADMRGTVFRRFWNRGRAPNDPAGDDIGPIHGWIARLGRNGAPTDDDGAPNLVVVIHGDIVRKLGEPILVINEATGNRWQPGSGTDHEPAFFGRLGRDTAYYGFEVSRTHLLSPAVKDKAYVLIYEPMGRLRFGLDVGTAAVREARRDYPKVSTPFPLAALGRDYSIISAVRTGAAQPAPARPVSWDELSWSDITLTDAGYVRFDSMTSVAPGGDLPGGEWTSASFARALWQKPVAVVMPMKRVL